MAEHKVVEIGDLESGVVEAGPFRTLRQEQGVVIGRGLAAVAAQEGAERELGGHPDLVRGDEAEAVLVPTLGRAEVGDIEHHVAESDHVRRAGEHALRCAKALVSRREVPGLRRRQID